MNMKRKGEVIGVYIYIQKVYTDRCMYVNVYMYIHGFQGFSN